MGVSWDMAIAWVAMMSVLLHVLQDTFTMKYLVLVDMNGTVVRAF